MGGTENAIGDPTFVMWKWMKHAGRLLLKVQKKGTILWSHFFVNNF